MTPYHVRLETYIREDEVRFGQRAFSVPHDVAAIHSERASSLAKDPRAPDLAVYMYARRAAHWGLYAMGERGPDLLPTYYRA